MEHDVDPPFFTRFKNEAVYKMMCCIILADHFLLCVKGKSKDNIMVFSVG